MEENKNQRLSDRFAGIEEWTIPILLLCILVVGVIRIAPWIKNKLFEAPEQSISATNSSTSETDHSDDQIQVNLDLAPVILVDDKDLPEIRSEDLTNALTSINDSITIDVQTDAAHSILTTELAMDQENAVIADNTAPEPIIQTAEDQLAANDRITNEASSTELTEDSKSTDSLETSPDSSSPKLQTSETNEEMEDALFEETAAEAQTTPSSAKDKEPSQNQNVTDAASEPSLPIERDTAVTSTNKPEPVVEEIQLAQTDETSVLVEEELVAKTAKIPKPTKATELAQKIDNATQIDALITQWSSAWANQNVDAYIASYADGHKGRDHDTAAQWQAWRRDRITAPTSIEVAITKRIISFDTQLPTVASAKFIQTYTTQDYADKVVKRLSFIKQEDGWKITKERTISAL